MTTYSSLHFQIPAGGAPEWVHLTPAGTFSGVDGRGPFTLKDPAAVIAASMAAGKLAIDENHAIDLAAPKGGPAPARGWIVEMQARSDGLWGRVEWTGEGRRLLDDRAYRGISPVMAVQKTGGAVAKILRASLVNEPNLASLTSLHSRSHDMDLAKLRQLLGLTADAAEDAILTTVTSHAAIAASLGKVAQAAGLKANATGDELVTHLQARASADPKLEAVKVALKAAGVDFEKATPEQLTTHLQAQGAGDAELRTTVISLQSKLDTLEATAAKEKAVAFVDAAIAAGKPIRAMRDHYVTRHQKDAAGVEAELNALVSIHSGGIVKPPKSEGGALDADELAACELMGLDPKLFAASKADLEKVAL